MEFTMQEIETITRAEKALKREKYSKSVMLACFLPLLVKMAAAPPSSQEPTTFLLMVLFCAVALLQPPRSPSYREHVGILSRHKKRDPLLESLIRSAD